MTIQKLATFISSLLLLSNILHGGEVRTWSPKELIEKSKLVIIGKVKETKLTNEKTTITFGNRIEGRKIPIVYAIAKIEVVEIIKGVEKVKMITFKFPKVDESKTKDIVHKSEISLTEGDLYLLYLNPTGNNLYLGSLNSEFHDGQSAKHLEPIKMQTKPQ